MPPKKATAQTGKVLVDGVAVPYSVDLKSRLVVVGTGVVSNSERDTFRQKASPMLEQQIKDRPRFAAILAAARSPDAAATVASQPSPHSRELDALLATMPPPGPPKHLLAVAAAASVDEHGNELDEHGNWLCSRCHGPTCAACELCSCLLQHDAGIALCGGCNVPYCNLPCSRRGDCREEGNETHQKHYDYGCFTDTGSGCQDCNAPLGLGCQCACCKRLGPPICADCTPAGPCNHCWEQWEYLEENGFGVCATSKYGAWREHWHAWCSKTCSVNMGTLPVQLMRQA